MRYGKSLYLRFTHVLDTRFVGNYKTLISSLQNFRFCKIKTGFERSEESLRESNYTKFNVNWDNFLFI